MGVGNVEQKVTKAVIRELTTIIVPEASRPQIEALVVNDSGVRNEGMDFIFVKDVVDLMEAVVQGRW